MSNELTHNPGQFDEVIHIIDNARSRAMKAVNAELIQMYWSVGAYLSELCSASKYSLQGTTQGRYLTGGVPPVRFSM